MAKLGPDPIPGITTSVGPCPPANASKHCPCIRRPYPGFAALQGWGDGTEAGSGIGIGTAALPAAGCAELPGAGDAMPRIAAEPDGFPFSVGIAAEVGAAELGAAEDTLAGSAAAGGEGVGCTGAACTGAGGAGCGFVERPTSTDGAGCGANATSSGKIACPAVFNCSARAPVACLMRVERACESLVRTTLVSLESSFES